MSDASIAVATGEPVVAAQANTPAPTFDIYMTYDYLSTHQVVIERVTDKAVYDASTKTFVPVANVTNPYLNLPPGTGPFIGRFEAHIALDPAQFTDGDYLVSFIRTDLPTKEVFSMSEVSVFNGSCVTVKPLTTSDIPALATAIAAQIPGGSGGGATVTQITTALDPKFNAIPTAVKAALPVPPTASQVADAVVAKLPTTSGGAAPSATDNANALLKFQYKTITDAGSVAAVLNATYTAAAGTQTTVNSINANLNAVATKVGNIGTVVSGLPNASTIATAFLKAQYKTVTDAGSVAALLGAMNTSMASINTSQASIAFNTGSIATRMDNVSLSLTNVWTSLNNLGTSQSKNSTALAAIQTQLNSMQATLAAIQTKLGA